MKLIVGLGNPGKEHESTRHNVGFMVVDQFLKDFESVEKTVWENSSKFKADIAHIDWQPKHGGLEKVILVKPKTYMNNSGLAAELLVSYFKLPLSDVWVIHDDVDLPLGSIRIRNGGSSGGHRGIESIIETIGDTKFWRFRLGIGHPHRDSSNLRGKEKMFVKDIDEFVIGTFDSSEKGKAKHLVKHASKAIATALEEDLERAMNQYNTK